MLSLDKLQKVKSIGLCLFFHGIYPVILAKDLPKNSLLIIGLNLIKILLLGKSSFSTSKIRHTLNLEEIIYLTYTHTIYLAIF